MDALLIIIALSLPVLLGSFWLNLLVPAATPARRILVWGNGSLAGLLAIALLMRLTDALGMTPGLPTTGVLAASLIVGAAALGFRLKPGPTMPSAIGFPALPPAHKALLALFAALLLLRLTTLGLEIIWRPLFPWDATMHWATKARAWFASGSIVPFVEHERWLELGGKGVFTDEHPGYPITTPLLQVWMNSAIGRWDESLMNLPWLLCLLALGAAFYAQARIAGATAVSAMGFCYLLLSMPLIDTHVALAGYADLFLGACYGAALMAFHNWSVTRQRWQGGLALVFALCCPLIKNEGFYWLLTFIPAVVVVLLPRRQAAALLSVVAIAAAAVVLLIPGDIAIAGHSLNRLDLHFQPEAMAGIAAILWVHDSWHLFFYLLPGLVLLGLLVDPGRTFNAGAGIITALASAICLFLILFLFTRYAAGAVGFTAAGRISVQLVPGMVFMALLLWSKITDQSRSC